MAQSLPQDIASTPRAFAKEGQAINALLKLGRAVLAMKGGNGVNVKVSDANILITLDPAAAAGAAGSRTPFAVVLQDVDTGDCSIADYSYLFTSVDAASSVSISSLSTLFQLSTLTHVWLHVDVTTDYEVSAASIETGYSFPSDLIVRDGGGVQTGFNVRIGHMVAGFSDGPGFDYAINGVEYHFKQLLNTNLLLELFCHNGLPAVYAFPWGGA